MPESNNSTTVTMDGAKVVVTGEKVVTTLTWKKLIGILGGQLVVFGAIFAWAVPKILDGRYAQAGDVQVIDAYVHQKGGERDVFAQSVNDQLKNISNTQQEMKATDLRMEGKLDRILLGQKNLSIAVGVWE